MSRSKSSGRHGAADGLFVRGMSRHITLLGAMGRLCGCAGLRLCALSDLNLKDKWALRLCFNVALPSAASFARLIARLIKFIKSKGEPRRGRDKKFLILFAVAFIGFAAMPFCYAPAALERAGVVLAGADCGAFALVMPRGHAI